MDYSKQVIENYTKKLANIENALKTTPLFPDRSSGTPQRFLDEKMEFILKVTFKLRVAFLEEMEFMLAFASSKATVEAMVLELEKQDYIKSDVSSDLGKYWVLTPTALYYFYTDRTIPYKSATIPAVSLPSSSNVMPLKCINGIIASRVFDEMTIRLYADYKENPTEYKHRYQKVQFVEQFILSNAQKKLSARGKMHIINDYLANNELSRESNEQYARFLKFFKEEATTIHLFNFLKGYLGSDKGLAFKEMAVETAYHIISRLPTNIYKDTSYSFRNKLFVWTKQSNRILNESRLFLVEEYLKQFSIAKRSLGNIKLENKTPEEIQAINTSTKELDTAIATYESYKARLTEEFNVMLYDKVGENNLPLFTEQRVTLESLRTSNVFITDTTRDEDGKVLLTFSILQPSFEEMSLAYLFSKLEKIYQFAFKNLLMADYRIKIITYDKKNADIVAGKLPVLKEEFSAMMQYALFLSHLSQIEVVPVERHFKERFEVFREIGKKV